MLQYQQLEAIIKKALSDYRESYNNMENENPDIDFNLLIQQFSIEREKLGWGVEGIDQRMFQGLDFDKEGKISVYYLRLALTEGEMDKVHKRVLFTSYRPTQLFKKKSEAYFAMYRECLSHLLAGGIEYSFAMSITKDKEILVA